MRFETIFPAGTGRTPHIHMKVFVSATRSTPGQVFFGATRTRLRPGPLRRGQSETSNRADSIYREAGNRALLELRRKGSGLRRLHRLAVIGVSPSGGR